MATKKQRFWYIDTSTLRPRMGIVEKATNAVTKDGYTSEYQSITEAKDITIYAIARDNDLAADALTATWTQIPEQFHSTIVDKVISIGYKDPRNFDMERIKFFDMEYGLGLKKAKHFSRSNYTSTGFIAPQDF